MAEQTKDLTARVRVEADDAQPLEKIEQSLRKLEPAAKDAGKGFSSAAGDISKTSKAADDLGRSSKGAAQGVGTATQRVKEFATAGKGVDSVGKSFLSLKSILGALGITAALTQVKRLLGFTLEAANVQAEAVAQVEAAIESTGGAAGLTAEELKKMAAGLQEVTTFGDEVILRGQSILLTFTNIGKDIFPEVTERSLDLATRLGTDLKSASIQLGKALNDPVKGLTALSRAGVSFTESQKDVIKSAVESGDILTAQRVILDELAKEFAGAARAARDTWGGAMEAAKNAAGDFAEKIGEGGLSGALARLADKFRSNAEESGGFASGIGAVLGTVVELVSGAATAVSAGFEAIAGAVGLAVAFVAEKLLDLGNGIAEALKGLGFEELGESVSSSLEDIGVVVEEFRKNTLSETEKDLRQARDSFGDVIDNITKIWTEGGEKVKASGQGFAGAFDELGNSADQSAAKVDSAVERNIESISKLLGFLPENAKETADALREAWESFDPTELRQRFLVLDDESKEAIRANFSQAVETIRTAGGEISEEMVRIGQSIGVLVAAFKPVEGAASSSAAAVQTSAGAIADSIDVIVTKYDEAGQKIVTTERITKEAARKMTLEEIRAAGPRLQEYVKQLKAAEEGLGETATKAKDAAAGLGEPAAKVSEVGESVDGLAKSSKDLAIAQDEAGEASKRQAEGLQNLVAAIQSGDLTKAIGSIGEQLTALNAIDFGPLLGKLDQVKAKVAEVAQAVSELDNAADGAVGEG